MGAGLAIVVGVLLSLVVVYGLTEYGRSTAQTWAALTVVFTMLAALIGAFLLLNRATLGAVVASLALGIVAHGTLAGTLRQLKPLSVAPLLTQALKDAGLHPSQGRAGPVAISHFHEPSFVFLTGTETELTDGPGAARALAEGRPVFVEDRDAEAFAQAVAELGASGQAVTTVRGYNYSDGEDVSLTLYAPPGLEDPKP